MTGGRALAIAAGAALGVIFCLAAIAVANALHVTPNFPAYRGEDDFTFRFVVFAVFGLPSFAVLGGWIGARAHSGQRSWPRAVGGAVGGSMAAWLLLTLLASRIVALPSSRESNAVFVAFLGAWIALSTAGTVLAGHRPRLTGR